MTQWADSHNHLHDERLGAAEPLVRAMRREGIISCVVNATQEADWPRVLQLAERYPDFVMPAFGVHPWLAHRVQSGWAERLRELLAECPPATIGECGLDDWVKSPPLAEQIPVFAAQLRIARQLNRPPTIHCLKAWNPLFEVFRTEPPPDRFLMHSFGGSAELADRLVKLGAYFSFSGYFLRPRKSAVVEVFRRIPPDRILLESDAPDMLPPTAALRHPLPNGHNHPANLAAIAAGLAEALGMEMAELSTLTLENHHRLFGQPKSASANPS
jgi:TatD DNase family protein